MKLQTNNNLTYKQLIWSGNNAHNVTHFGVVYNYPNY